MTKTKLIFIAMALALVTWVGASAASAQDGPTVTADPAYVDAPGEHEFTLTGSGFTAASVNATSCPADQEVTPSNFLTLCGLGSAATSTGDGGFTATITATVGEAGVSLQMVELRAGGESASVLVTVGTPDTGDDTGEEMPEDMDETGDETSEDEGSEDMGDETSEDEGSEDMGSDMSDPGTVVDVAVASGDFPTLVAAVQAAGLVDTLSGEGPFTVFAPTEDAFAEALSALGMSAEELLGNVELLTSVLTYHVLPVSAPAATVVGLDGQGVATVQGAEVQVSVDGDTVMVNDATVVTTDVMASNGVIHVIDKVLLPPSDDMGDEMGSDEMGSDEMGDGMLADTGQNTMTLAIIAVAVVLAGAMVLGLSRRLRTTQ